MIANENQYQVTQRWERDFSKLVEYMESSKADTILEHHLSSVRLN